jgi:DNA-binding IscR family transcriptional regulator
MEGELAMTECCESTNLCAIDSMCTLRENWRKINKMVYQLLAHFSIQDMLCPLSMPNHLMERAIEGEYARGK